MRRSLLLLATDFAPRADVGGRRRGRRSILSSRSLSFVDQIKSAAFFSVPCALVRALIRRQKQFIQFRISLFYLFQRQFCRVTSFSVRRRC